MLWWFCGISTSWSMPPPPEASASNFQEMENIPKIFLIVPDWFKQILYTDLVWLLAGPPWALSDCLSFWTTYLPSLMVACFNTMALKTKVLGDLWGHLWIFDSYQAPSMWNITWTRTFVVLFSKLHFQSPSSLVCIKITSSVDKSNVKKKGGYIGSAGSWEISGTCCSVFLFPPGFCLDTKTKCKQHFNPSHRI